MITKFKSENLATEYNRWQKKLNLNLVPTDREFLSPEEILRAHFLIVDSFNSKGDGIGGIGPKSIELLEGAVARQVTSFEGRLQFPSVLDRAAVVLHGITRSHPFHDANKRTAFLSTLHLLKKNKLIPIVDDKQFEDFVVSVADGSFRKLKKFAEFSHQQHSDVMYISYYLGKITRETDKKDYVVTFYELDKILRRFGFKFDDLDRNYIKVRRMADDSYVCQVGCPSMSKQVSVPAIRTIRKETELDALHSVDSATFFKDEERLDLLLAKYYEPLMRLADR